MRSCTPVSCRKFPERCLRHHFSILQLPPFLGELSPPGTEEGPHPTFWAVRSVLWPSFLACETVVVNRTVPKWWIKAVLWPLWFQRHSSHGVLLFLKTSLSSLPSYLENITLLSNVHYIDLKNTVKQSWKYQVSYVPWAQADGGRNVFRLRWKALGSFCGVTAYFSLSSPLVSLLPQLQLLR